jgi:hypothetical protein
MTAVVIVVLVVGLFTIMTLCGWAVWDEMNREDDQDE